MLLYIILSSVRSQVERSGKHQGFPEASFPLFWTAGNLSTVLRLPSEVANDPGIASVHCQTNLGFISNAEYMKSKHSGHVPTSVSV